jgi:hypothetical protein
LVSRRSVFRAARHDQKLSGLQLADASAELDPQLYHHSNSFCAIRLQNRRSVKKI